MSDSVRKTCLSMAGVTSSPVSSSGSSSSLSSSSSSSASSNRLRTSVHGHGAEAKQGMSEGTKGMRGRGKRAREGPREDRGISDEGGLDSAPASTPAFLSTRRLDLSALASSSSSSSSSPSSSAPFSLSAQGLVYVRLVSSSVILRCAYFSANLALTRS